MNRTQAMTHDAHRTHEGFRLSDSPPDVVQKVSAVVQGLAASGWEDIGRSHAAAGDDFWLSDPPRDLIQSVQVMGDGPVALVNAQARSISDRAMANSPLAAKEADYTEEIGEAEDPERDSAEPEATAVLDNQEIYRIIREVAVADSGDDLYSAVSVDQQNRFGVAFGLVHFTQKSGRLGSVLRLMYRRDPTSFTEIFGPEVENFLMTTNASAPEDRLKPVGGEPLWGATWVERFRRAGAVPAFQAAQNEEAIEGQFRPMLKVAFGVGLVSDRGLAMVYDRVVTHGLGGGLRWVVQAAGSLRTAAQRAYALQTLGYESVQRFQASTGGIPQDGRFGPETHAALLSALRRQGIATLPGPEELVWRLAAMATGATKQRLVRLRDSAALNDNVYSLD